jgi:hypothetical protein
MWASSQVSVLLAMPGLGLTIQAIADGAGRQVTGDRPAVCGSGHGSEQCGSPRKARLWTDWWQILFGAWLNSGQICMSTERIIVHDAVFNEFEVELRKAAEAVKGKDLELVRAGAGESLQGMIDEAITEVGRARMDEYALTVDRALDMLSR